MREANGYSIITSPGERPVEHDLSNCAHCHGDDARGDEGPDLHGVTKSDARIASFIKNGIKGEMPKFGAKLSDADVQALQRVISNAQAMQNCAFRVSSCTARTLPERRVPIHGDVVPLLGCSARPDHIRAGRSLPVAAGSGRPSARTAGLRSALPRAP